MKQPRSYYYYNHKNKCKDCKKIICNDAIYCSSCKNKHRNIIVSEKRKELVSKANSGKNHGMYIDGRTLQIKYCKCGNLMNWDSILCWTCHLKNRIGNKSSNWKGGATEFKRLIRESHLYEKWRTQIFKRDNYTCKICNKIGGKLCVHHKIPFSSIIKIFNIKSSENALKCTLLWEPSWGITLCQKCHRKIHRN